MTYTLNWKETGRRIKKERKEAGYVRQGDFAVAMNLSSESRQTISRWENGEVLPSIDDLLLMCQLFDCEIDYLLGAIKNKTRQETDIQKELKLSPEAQENIRLYHHEPDEVHPTYYTYIDKGNYVINELADGSYEKVERTITAFSTFKEDSARVARIHSKHNIIDKIIRSDEFLSLISGISRYATKKPELESPEVRDTFYHNVFSPRPNLPDGAVYISPDEHIALLKTICIERFGEVLEDVVKKIIAEEATDNGEHSQD